MRATGRRFEMSLERRRHGRQSLRKQRRKAGMPVEKPILHLTEVLEDRVVSQGLAASAFRRHQVQSEPIEGLMKNVARLVIRNQCLHRGQRSAVGLQEALENAIDAPRAFTVFGFAYAASPSCHFSESGASYVVKSSSRSSQSFFRKTVRIELLFLSHCDILEFV
jgi:hypothetical protein